MKPVTGTIVACVQLALLLSTASVAQEAGDFEELTLEISTTSRSMLPMEILPLVIAISNKTDHPVRVPMDIQPGGSRLKVYVAPCGRPFSEAQFGSGLEVHYSGEASRRLPSGYERCWHSYLWRGDTRQGNGKALFPRPGVYLLKTVLTSEDGGSTAESNTLTLTVESPTGVDSAACTFMTRESEGDEPSSFFFLPEANEKRAQKLGRLKALIARFPESRYAGLAWYALGRAYYDVGKRDEQELAYEKVLGWKDFPLRDTLLYTLAHISLKGGDIAKAKHRLATLKTEYPASELTASIDRQISAAEKEK